MSMRIALKFVSEMSRDGCSNKKQSLTQAKENEPIKKGWYEVHGMTCGPRRLHNHGEW